MRAAPATRTPRTVCRLRLCRATPSLAVLSPLLRALFSARDDAARAARRARDAIARKRHRQQPATRSSRFDAPPLPLRFTRGGCRHARAPPLPLCPRARAQCKMASRRRARRARAPACAKRVFVKENYEVYAITTGSLNEIIRIGENRKLQVPA